METINQEFLNAITSGDSVTTQVLLESDSALINTCDEHGTSALMLSVYHGQENVTRILLAFRPAIELFEAAALGDTRRLAEINPTKDQLATFSHDGFTALHLAAFFGHIDTVKLLLDRGANVNVSSRNTTFAVKVTPLHSAVARGQREIVRMLIEAGADVNARQEGGATALHAAAFNGDEEIVGLLFRHGADVQATTDEGKTPFDLAVERGHHAVAKLLRGMMKV